MLRFSLALLALLFLAACDTADPVGPDPDPDPQTTGLIVGAQGAFGQDTGGLVRFNLDGTVAQRYPEGAGVYVQSNDVLGDRLFVTTGSRVDVLNPETFARTAQFSVPNPRYVAADGSEAFVTSLYTNPTTFDEGAVTRLDLNTGATGEPVVIGGNPEGVAVTASHVFVANHDFGGGSTVTRLNRATLGEVDRIEVCEGPRFLFVDAQNEVLVVCEGGGFGDEATNGAIAVLDGATGALVTRIDLDAPLRSAGSGQTASFDPVTQTLFALDNGNRRVVRFDAAANALLSPVSVGGAPLNGIAYDAAREYLVLARFAAGGNPYDEQGTLTIHTRDGALVDTFQGAGIAPTHVAIRAEVTR